MLVRRSLLLAGLVALFSAAGLIAADPVAGPSYQIVLRSRHAEARPQRTKDAQTGGAYVLVEQPEANTIVATMGGAAVAGSTCNASAAAIEFNLNQELEIIPTRKGLRPPRVGMVGRVVGTLAVSDGGKHSKACGSAEQGPASACLVAGDVNVLCVNLETSSVGGGQELSINHRNGPVEAVATEGCFRLTGTFRIAVTQGKGAFHRQYALADFDPAPQLDGYWSDILKPFRAVPRKDFGFKVVVRVVEESAEAATPAK